MRRLFIFLFFLFLYAASYTLYANAQNLPVDLANIYDIKDKDAVDGDIVMYDKDKGIVRADAPFSNKLFGVLQDKPIAVYRIPGNSGKPVVRSGTAYVNVTSDNGAIKAGDYITSSRKAGKGQKAVDSGYVLGTALQEMSGTEAKIPVAVRIEYAELTNTKSVLRLLDYFNIAAFQSTQDPDRASQLVKYLLSGMIVIIALLISFMVFGRSVIKSIDAIGRNPLAKNAIMLSLLINGAFTFVLVIAAIGIAFVILKL